MESFFSQTKKKSTKKKIAKKGGSLPFFSRFCLWDETLFLCHNPNLGLATKAKACEVAGQERSPGITLHALGCVGKCEGMNPHTPKGASTLGVGVPMDFRMFKEQLQVSKPNGLKSFLYHWKSIET